MYLVELALATPLRKLFSYSHTNALTSGQRVVAPFNGRQVFGIVIRCEKLTENNTPSFKLKKLSFADSNACLFSPLQLKWLNWLSTYYQHPLGDVVDAATPKLLKQAKDQQALAESFSEKHYRLNPEANTSAISKQSKAQLAIVSALQNGSISHAAFKQRQLSASALKALIEKQIVDAFHDCALLKPSSLETLQINAGLALNSEQYLAVQQINQANTFQSFLLNGITGSGKTEVYLQAISHCLEQGKQALVLVPEIGLTPQTIARFTERFDCPIALFHSGLNDKERLKTFLSAQAAHAGIIIGTRSALFCEAPKLGLIIIDEEHDLSYKQQEGFRYHARDAAIMRAKFNNIPIVLGSATPSLESLHNCEKDKSTKLILSERATEASLPQIELVNLKHQALYEGLSDRAINALKDTLLNKQQALIFINRRGFAHNLICHQCGWQADCHACSSKMTIHLSANHLRCHHCEHTAPIPSHCQACNSDQLIFQGVGTQRLESYLNDVFTDSPIFRIDRDSTKSLKQLNAQLDSIHQCDDAILIGTQMLAKGHHFPKLSLVIMLDCDQSLASTDYRQEERLAQLLLQVTGRAGRSEFPGRALIQTHYPEHPIFNQVFSEGYRHFAIAQLEQREVLSLPPFSFQALLRLDHKNEDECVLQLETLKTFCDQFCQKQGTQVFAVGPFPAPLQKRAHFYRYQLLLQADNRAALLQLTAALHAFTPTLIKTHEQRFSIDIDPQDMS